MLGKAVVEMMMATMGVPKGAVVQTPRVTMDRLRMVAMVVLAVRGTSGCGVPSSVLSSAALDKNAWRLPGGVDKN